MSLTYLDLPHSKRQALPLTAGASLSQPYAAWLPVDHLVPGEPELQTKGGEFFLGFYPLMIVLPPQVGAWPFLVCLLLSSEVKGLAEGGASIQAVARAAQERGGCYLMPDFGADLLELRPVADVPDLWFKGGL